MKKILIAMMMSAISTSAWAVNVEGAWPQEARGGSLRKPAWVLVIPAKRQSDGNLLVWDRADDWVRQWIVPKATPGGIRTVAIVGDSEDKRLVSASHIDNMQSSALRQIAAKYNAPAIALTVSGDDGQVVAVWVPGQHATWDYANGNRMDRNAALETMDLLFAGKQSSPEVSSTSGSTNTVQVQIVAERFNQDRQVMEYRIRAQGDEAEYRLGNANGLLVLGRATDDPHVYEVRMKNATSIEAALENAGLRVQ